MPLPGVQSSPGWGLGYVPPASEWDATWKTKADASKVVAPQVVRLTGLVSGSTNNVVWPVGFVNSAGAATAPSFVTATPLAGSPTTPGNGASYSIGSVTAAGCVLYVGAGGSATQDWLVRGEL